MILIISLLGFGILYKFLPLILRIIPAKLPRRLLIQLFMQDIQNNMQHLVCNLEWLSDIKRMSNCLLEKKIINLTYEYLYLF